MQLSVQTRVECLYTTHVLARGLVVGGMNCYIPLQDVYEEMGSGSELRQKTVVGQRESPAHFSP
jgi:hypothetical protein